MLIAFLVSCFIPRVLRAPPNAILQPNFKFEDMGIGGLDSEFSAIFRRAFASRIFPPGLVEKLGIQHVKGSSLAPFFIPLLLVSQFRGRRRRELRHVSSPPLPPLLSPR